MAYEYDARGEVVEVRGVPRAPFPLIVRCRYIVNQLPHIATLERERERENITSSDHQVLFV